MQKITACLWCNDQAEEAARFYPSIFTNAAIGAITHDGEGSPRPKGSVLTGRFQLHGQEFLALNGGPQCTFTEAVSFIVHCETQEELDRKWEQLSEGGRTMRLAEGSLRAVVADHPHRLAHDAERSQCRAGGESLQAVMRMKKLDINALEEAFGPRS
jgi:predicted 3-demethylubiquinone-9 3-methyltransferase (glyoxalase superfamily)